MLVWIASANRDPTFFPDADVFDVKRSRNRHLSFGLGVHSCLGAHLGRLEARLAIGALLRRLTNLQRADAAPPEMLPSFMAYGVKHLNVHFEQRPSPTLQEDGNGDGRTT
jgi:cytochrome P450